MAALRFANHINKKLHFHINYDRVEMGGNPVLHNLMSMFLNLAVKGHVLVKHEWENHVDFKKLCHTLDIGLQVSYTETFNIVGADIVSEGIPLIGHDIPWLGKDSVGGVDSSEDIYKKMVCAYTHPEKNVNDNQIGLKTYSEKAQDAWLLYFKIKKPLN